MRRLRDRKKQTEVPETRSDVKPILPYQKHDLMLKKKEKNGGCQKQDK